MEQHHDEHIDCADCGASFVFSADEAAVFAGRGLTAPKRCKDCRRARKERAASEGQGGPRRPGAFGAREGSFGARDGNQAPRPYGNAPQAAGRWNGPPRGAAPRYGAQPRQYTGDVNEYRSPMQDGASGASTGMPPRRFAPPQSDYRGGEYRSPMPDGNNRRGPRAQGPATGTGAPRFRDDRRPRTAARPHGAGEHAPAPEAPEADGAPQAAAGPHPAANKRRRPQAEMFPVTCNACGAQAEVPFKPAEGREVFCPTCYRARRPA